MNDQFIATPFGERKARMGFIYYIACPTTFRVKIGFTRGSPNARLKNLQTGSATPLTLIAVERGTIHDEAALHAKYAEHRLHGEWFTMCEELFNRLHTIVWLQAKQSIALGEPIADWVRRGLKNMHEEIAPLPDEL